MKIKAKTGDLALGIFSILGGIIILILTKVQGLQLIKGGQMGPGFFPTICGIAIAICGAMVLLEAARRDRPRQNGPGGEGRTGDKYPEPDRAEESVAFYAAGDWGTAALRLSGAADLPGTECDRLFENMGPRKVDQVDRDRCMYGGVPVRGLCPVPACAGSPKVRWAFKEEVHIWTCCITLRWASQSWLIP